MIRMLAHQTLAQFATIQLGHVDICEDQIRRLREDNVEPFFAIHGNGDVMPHVLELLHENFPKIRLIFDNDDFGHRCGPQ